MKPNWRLKQDWQHGGDAGAIPQEALPPPASRRRHLATRFAPCLLGLLAFLAPPALPAEPESIRLILVGDSTMAPRTGYGDALCARFRPNVTCINLARGGRSSGSFRTEGLWDNIIRLLRESKAYRMTYVLIQFGHNDQPGKPGRSTDLAVEFPANMARYVEEVKVAHAAVVLVTPLTRRMFRDNALDNDLKPWADATRRVAKDKAVALVDLNAASAAAVAAMGASKANQLAMAPPPDNSVAAAQPAASQKFDPHAVAQVKFDHTHLGEKGANYISAMVARELVQVLPVLGMHLKLSGPEN